MITDLKTGEEIPNRPTLQNKTYIKRKKKKPVSIPWMEIKENDNQNDN